MIKFVPLAKLIFVSAYVTLLFEPALLFAADLFEPSNATPILEDLLTVRIIAICISLIFAALTIKPVWRLLWRTPWIGPKLSKTIFPDLNGNWEFDLNSNWPIIDKMRLAAKGDTERIDTLAEDADLPELLRSTFQARIDQGWYSMKVTFAPNDTSRLLESKTLSVDLISGNELDGKRLAWTFKQTNKQPRDSTDEQFFIGSALLESSPDGRVLSGRYWTNRTWDRGLNSAGTIVGRKI